ncbi:threonine aldolase family protein [Petrocella sp. FN5]|uniref:threonine aldolase family protein n=1 Tax=Petrocella sp. FN5 TaxID=3032002 RepID=UPI0023DB67CC|nr:aminotransferase class I/II-fold pyridoxal phosphate-dependent enzyme [Petrocella sp. FN5]MDF1617691.1 aminotransferase class I/II-fold pyridoxal phosphate-dependent enzyme [Petrocella sp. FN5]
MKTFKSDNTASVHPEIMEAIIKANEEHAIPYGDDPITKEAVEKIKALFSRPCEVSLVLNGTGANIIGLSTLLKSYEAVICVDTAHINVDECGAFERYTGAKLLTVPHINGKLVPAEIDKFLLDMGNEHHNQPKVISISQITELGTLYTTEEIKTLADYAHSHGLLLHVDGARIANGAVALGVSLDEMIGKTDVDVLSFGGAKNGMMYGEAIVSFDRTTSDSLKYVRKQGMQLMSKMRYISAQYIALLEGELYLRNARKANDAMSKLYEEIKDIEALAFMNIPYGNMMFVKMPQIWIDKLLTTFYFYQMTWEEDGGMIRLVTSFDTSLEEVENLIKAIKELSQNS